MISIGGSATNNGIKFQSERYNLRFSINKYGERELYLKKVLNDKRNFSVIYYIPLLRGVYSLIRQTPILLILPLTEIMQMTGVKLVKSTDDISKYSGYSLIFILAIILVFFTVHTFLNIFIKNKYTWQYHGAEHKAINAYLGGNLCFKNAKNIKRYNDRCGTGLVVFLIVIMSILFPVFKEINSLLLFLSMAIAYEFFNLTGKLRKLFIISFLFKISRLAQIHLFTREPNDEQLKNAVETLQLLIDIEEGKISEEQINLMLKKN